ncbi:hypothetical protein D3C71_1949610 [compost metagenome]
MLHASFIAVCLKHCRFVCHLSINFETNRMLPIRKLRQENILIPIMIIVQCKSIDEERFSTIHCHLQSAGIGSPDIEQPYASAYELHCDSFSRINSSP